MRFLSTQNHLTAVVVQQRMGITDGLHQRR